MGYKLKRVIIKYTSNENIYKFKTHLGEKKTVPGSIVIQVGYLTIL